MNLARDAFLVASAAAAGAINSVAGGGTLLSFPAALAAGLPPVMANATNAVALTPGSLAAAWSYRHFLGDKRRLVALLALPATVGAVLGAIILRHTSASVFAAVVPWLLLAATLVMLLQELGLRLGARTPATAGQAPASGPASRPASEPASEPASGARARLALVIFFQLLVGIYGGYFGAAMGIVMLAYLALIGRMEIHQMNAIKNALAGLVNGVASVYFVARGMVDGRAAALMTVGAILGGVAGARVARRIHPRVVRWMVIVIGLGLALVFALRGFGKT